MADEDTGVVPAPQLSWTSSDILPYFVDQFQFGIQMNSTVDAMRLEVEVLNMRRTYTPYVLSEIFRFYSTAG